MTPQEAQEGTSEARAARPGPITPGRTPNPAERRTAHERRVPMPPGFRAAVRAARDQATTHPDDDGTDQ